MKPEPPRVLQGVMINLVMNVLPEVSTPHGQQTVQLAAGLVNMVAQEFDRAADRLVTERSALAVLFGDAATKVTEPGLHARLDAAANLAPPASLSVNALQSENDRLRALLGELLEHVEALDAPWAQALEGAIWEELRESTRRRHLASGLA